MLNLILEHKKLLEEALNNKIQLNEKFFIYNDQMIKNFQHERLAHLLVTLFFGLITILAFIFVYSNVQSLCGYILIAILIVMTFFYTIYYFRLENAVQEIYKLTKEIYKKSNML